MQAEEHRHGQANRALPDGVKPVEEQDLAGTLMQSVSESLSEKRAHASDEHVVSVHDGAKHADGDHRVDPLYQ